MEGYSNGRGKNQAFTSGAQNAQGFEDGKGNKLKTTDGMKQAWEKKEKVKTYTSSRHGRMSTNGRTAGGSTWTFTQKDSDGNKIRQSGRSGIAIRRQRYYDVRVGLGLSGG